MLLQIPGVLKKDELETVMRELGQGAYEDGRVSAGLIARDVKKNLQVKRDAEAAQKCARRTERNRVRGAPVRRRYFGGRGT